MPTSGREQNGSRMLCSHRVMRHASGALAVLVGFGLALWMPQRDDDAPAAVPPVIHADFWYDVSDPTLISGDAAFVVVGDVVETLKHGADRTLFRVRVLEELKGRTPDEVVVSQMGTVIDGVEVEVEGFPLMRTRATYILAMTAPSPSERSDALIVLTAQGRGNRVEVSGVSDPLVDSYRRAVANATSPYPPDETTADVTKQYVDEWARSRPQYAPVGPARASD